MCDLFGVLPDRTDGRGRSPAPGSNLGRGKVTGSGDERTYTCPSCNRTQVVKSNKALAEEYARLSRLNRRTKRESCPSVACINHGATIDLMPSRYRKFGKTAKGDPRYQCKACKKTFSLGKSNRRHFRSDLNGKVFGLLVNGMTLSSISRYLQTPISEVYRKIDFIHEQCQAFAAERERKLPSVLEGGCPHFATDTQLFQVNWPDKGVRRLVEVRHMCTVHSSSKYVVASTTDVDPEVHPVAVQKAMELTQDFNKPRSMRDNARIWFAQEYVSYIRDKHDATNSSTAHDREPYSIDEDIQLLEKAARVRQDAAEFAHIMLVKKKLGNQYRFLNFSVDRDAGVSSAFLAVFRPEVCKGVVRIADVAMRKNATNPRRMKLVAWGKAELTKVEHIMQSQGFVTGQGDHDVERRHDGPTEALLRMSLGKLSQKELQECLMDHTGQSATAGFHYPFHFINEPNKRVIFRTDPTNLDWAQLAQFIVRAGTHPVDMYHARARTKVMGFERGLSTSGPGRLWYYKQYYNPVMVMKMVDILRFAHNYTNRMSGQNESPAMKLGLAKGFVYERDLFSF